MAASAKDAKLNVIAIDPGERVGWCTAEYTPGSGAVLKKHGISSLKQFALTFEQRCELYDVVIYEKFVLFKGDRGRAQEGSEMPTSQLIGMIRLTAWVNDKKLVSQAPIKKKTADKVATGEFKKLIDGETGAHDDNHDIDAVRHLAYWVWKQEVKDAK